MTDFETELLAVLNRTANTLATIESHMRASMNAAQAKAGVARKGMVVSKEMVEKMENMPKRRTT